MMENPPKIVILLLCLLGTVSRVVLGSSDDDATMRYSRIVMGEDGGGSDEEDVCVRLSVLLTDNGNGSNEIVAKLMRKWAPKTVDNFVEYVDADFYTDTVFHRIISGFMVQGGGFPLDFYAGQRREKNGQRGPIKLEARADVPNLEGTLAMARTNAKDSATSQFFINLVDNHFLDHSAGNDGYTVFGKVLRGIEVVRQMGAVPTTTVNGMASVPSSPVVLQSVSRHPCP